MSAVNDFVSELVRAANELDLLANREKRRLLERSVTAIRDMREEIGIPPTKTIGDAVIDLQATEFRIMRGTASAEEVRAALLDAAGMIRDLHIIMDTNLDIVLNGSEDN